MGSQFSLKTIKEETPSVYEEKINLDNYQKMISREPEVKHVRFSETKSKKEVLSEHKNSRQG